MLPLVPLSKRPIAEGVLSMIEQAENRLKAAEQGAIELKREQNLIGHALADLGEYTAELARVVNAQGERIKQLTEALAPSNTKAVH